MKRHAKTAYAFAAALAVKGEPIGDAELSHYFAAPGQSSNLSKSLIYVLLLISWLRHVER